MRTGSSRWTRLAVVAVYATAMAVVFLAAESSRYVSGQTLLVDGGISTGSTRATVKIKT